MNLVTKRSFPGLKYLFTALIILIPLKVQDFMAAPNPDSIFRSKIQEHASSQLTGNLDGRDGPG